MKEIPMLMNGEMMRANLAGRKTLTTRPLKCGVLAHSSIVEVAHQWLTRWTVKTDAGSVHEFKCPFGTVGDRLWFRENWHAGAEWDAESPKEIDQHGGLGDLWYPADGTLTTEFERIGKRKTKPESMGKCRPSIHMPRGACRMTAITTEIRVECVQDITEADAVAEGVEFRGTYWLGGIHPVKGSMQCWNTARDAFKAIWDGIAKPGHKWADNDFVWRIRYELEGRA